MIAMKPDRPQTACDMTPEPFEDELGSLEGSCYGCETFARLNDLSLCGDCAAKLDRDLIRQRDWDDVMLAFGVPVAQREALRQEIIDTDGANLELIAPESAKRRPCNRRRRRSSRRDTT